MRLVGHRSNDVKCAEGRQVTMSDTPVDKTVEVGEKSGLPLAADGVSRRRLLRAGLAVAPVAAALHSTPVLATGGGSCIRPSSYASLNRGADLQISKHRTLPKEYTCKPASHWATQSDTIGRSLKNVHPKLADSDKTFGHFLSLGSSGEQLTDRQRLRKVLCAYYLTAEAKGDNEVLLTRAECATIWSDKKWSPYFDTAGATAQYLETMANGVTITQV